MTNKIGMFLFALIFTLALSFGFAGTFAPGLYVYSGTNTGALSYTSTTFANITGMGTKSALPGGGAYHWFDITCDNITINGTANGFALKLTGAGLNAVTSQAVCYQENGPNYTPVAYSFDPGSSTVISCAPSGVTTMGVHVWGQLSTSTAGGVVQVQGAQSVTSATATTIPANNCYVKYMEMGN